MLLRDGGSISLIALVDEAVDAVLGRVLLGLLHPVAHHVFEGLGVGRIVDQDDCVGPFVVGAGESSESLLSGGIPDL